MRPFATAILFSALAVGLTACAAGTADASQAAAGGPLSQLVLGFWHGLIAPVTLLVEAIHRYAPGIMNLPWHMYGGDSVPYDIGFYLGLAGGPSFLFWRR